MRLRGVLRELAMNCAIREQDGDRWSLVLDPGHQQLLNKERQQRLEKQVCACVQRSISLEIEIQGYDLGALRTASDDVLQRLRSSDRFADVESSVERGHPEIQIYFDQERAASLGLTVKQISDQVVEQVIRPTGLLDPKIEVRPAAQQVDDLLEEIQKRIAGSERVLVTTLTKRMAEDLTEYYSDLGLQVRYLQTLTEIAGDKSSTIVFPLDLVEKVKKALD